MLPRRLRSRNEPQTLMTSALSGSEAQADLGTEGQGCECFRASMTPLLRRCLRVGLSCGRRRVGRYQVRANRAAAAARADLPDSRSLTYTFERWRSTVRVLTN